MLRIKPRRRPTYERSTSVIGRTGRVYRVSELIEASCLNSLIVWAAFPALPTLAVRPVRVSERTWR